MSREPKADVAKPKPSDSVATSRKTRIWLRLDRDVVDHFRSSKRNWNEDANAILAAHVKQ